MIKPKMSHVDLAGECVSTVKYMIGRWNISGFISNDDMQEMYDELDFAYRIRDYDTILITYNSVLKTLNNIKEEFTCLVEGVTS